MMDSPGDFATEVGVLEEGGRQMLEQWNDTARPVPAVTVPELVAAVAARCPDAVAVVCGQQVVTYGELEAAAGRLAVRLAGLGAGPETVVAVLMDRSAVLVSALLAVWKTGAAYLPLDPGYPAARIGFMLADAAPVLVLADAAAAGGVPGTVPVLVAEDLAAAVPDDPAPASSPSPAPSQAPALAGVRLLAGNAAYVIYTSGSTGVPKGVVVTHGGLANYVCYITGVYRGLAQMTLWHAPASFDAGVTALYGALAAGGCVHVAALDGSWSAPAGGGGCYGLVNATPSHLPVLEMLGDGCVPARELLLGGEAVRSGPVQRWRERHPAVTVVNHYGPTEATVSCLNYRIEPGRQLAAGDPPVGSPVANTRVYVLDRWLGPVPVGVAGELYVAGAGRADGRAVCGVPVRRAGTADVPDRGSGPVDC